MSVRQLVAGFLAVAAGLLAGAVVVAGPLEPFQAVEQVATATVILSVAVIVAVT